MVLEKIHNLQQHRWYRRNCNGQSEMSFYKFPENKIANESPNCAVKNFMGEITIGHGKSRIQLVREIINDRA